MFNKRSQIFKTEKIILLLLYNLHYYYYYYYGNVDTLDIC